MQKDVCYIAIWTSTTSTTTTKRKASSVGKLRHVVSGIAPRSDLEKSLHVFLPSTVMPGSLKKSEKIGKKEKKAAKTKNEPPVKVTTQMETEDEEGSEDDEEDDGVNEEGMARLMKALGEDGVDDFGRMQLEALAGEEDGSGEGSDDEDDWESDAEEKVAQNEDERQEEDEVDEEDDDEEAEVNEGKVPADVALDNADVVDDDDAVPRQKIEVDNKVRSPLAGPYSFTDALCGQIAMDRILDTIKLDPKMSWTETLSVTYPETIDVDVEDDLSRELALYVFPSFDSHIIPTAPLATNKPSTARTLPEN